MCTMLWSPQLQPPSTSCHCTLTLGVHTERSAIWVRAERTMSLPRLLENHNVTMFYVGKKISYKRIICSMAMLVYQTVSFSSLCLFRLFLHLVWAQFFQRIPLGIPTVSPLDKAKSDMVGYICHSILIKWTVSPPGNIKKRKTQR